MITILKRRAGVLFCLTLALLTALIGHDHRFRPVRSKTAIVLPLSKAPIRNLLAAFGPSDFISKLQLEYAPGQDAALAEYVFDEGQLALITVYATGEKKRMLIQSAFLKHPFGYHGPARICLDQNATARRR